MKQLFSFVIFGSFALTAHAHGLQATTPVHALSDLAVLNALKIPVIAKNDAIGVGYAVLTPEMQDKVSALNHQLGRCAGYEVLPATKAESTFRGLQDLAVHVDRDRRAAMTPMRRFAVQKRPEIVQALTELREDGMRDFVMWASNFPTRDNRQADPNVAVRALVDRLKVLAGTARQAGVPMTVELINHQSTKQQSVRVSIQGRTRPQEVVVLGGHFDSINQSLGGVNKRSPGADDNASGSAAVFEALRVLLSKGQPARTLEFYWYAGEESGLLGSAEIAAAAKQANRQIIAVLQLDMTLFPGNGEFVVGNISDYTSSWLRDLLVSFNEAYLGIRLVDDKCGYACSDHASWYRQGYPTLMPFEATLHTMNRNIHTANDAINAQSDFKHALVFAKIATAFAMELGNSDARQPY